MGLLAALLGRSDSQGPCRPARAPQVSLQGPEPLETRALLSVSAVLTNGILSVTGDDARNHIELTAPPGQPNLIVSDFGRPVEQLALGSVQGVSITTGNGADTVVIDKSLLQPVVVNAGNGGDIVYAGGGPTSIQGGTGNDKLIAGSGPDSFDGGGGTNRYFQVKSSDTVVAGPADRVFPASNPPTEAPTTDPNTVLNTSDVSQLLDRAAAATSYDSAIVAVVDRNGRLLGVRVEGGVSSAITSSPATLTFAIDGALAEARTAAFFSNNSAPLTSRTIEFISQSTITQREVDSNPNITDPNSPLAGPGLVAPVGVGGHFPPNVPFTPQVDLDQIELTNRDSIINPGPDGIKGTADDITLPSRFNVPTQDIPTGQTIYAPESYGYLSGIMPDAQARGIGTLPGGIPLYKDGVLVGGIGVFFPGTTGYATEENSALSSTYDPSKQDLSMVAEYIAFAAAGGSSGAGYKIGTLGGVPALQGFDLPFGRIDLVGITLDIYGPQGIQGPQILTTFGKSLGIGDANSGMNDPVDSTGDTLLTGTPVPSGWLVTPHAGGGLTADDVTQIIQAGINQANQTRAAIRLPLGSTTRMVFAVTDSNGNVLGLYRMPDATIFSIDVAVAKARNVAYYDDPSQLQPQDEVPGIPPGASFTARTFRYLAQPFFPEGIDYEPPGPFSILNDGGADLHTGLQVGPPQPASAFQSVLGYAAFHPTANFHDPNNVANQNGVVFFPGSSALYKNSTVVVGGLGVSGDGVDQDDVVTFTAAQKYLPPESLHADEYFYQSIRLPYFKFDRNAQEL